MSSRLLWIAALLPLAPMISVAPPTTWSARDMPTPGTLHVSAPGLYASSAFELKPHTLEAFKRYVELTEKRIDGQSNAAGPFLYLENQSRTQRSASLSRLRRGDLIMQRMETRAPDGEEIEVDDGLIHHWLGAVFVPGATLEQTLALVQSYDRHAQIYAPEVDASHVIERRGDDFTIFMRFRKEKVITVVVNTEQEVTYGRPAPGRAWARSRTTRVREIEDAGKTDEREKPPDEASGFLWQLNSYWRFLESDDGMYIECESISLTRGIPFLLGWLIGPFVNDVPRESLTFLLETTRAALSDKR